MKRVTPSNCLCREAQDPHSAPDKVRLNCELEEGSFAPATPPDPPRELQIAAYNLERGLELDGQIELLQRHPDLSQADVLLLSEADRGCSRSGSRNVTAEIAQALGMHYAFAVQYVELPREARRRANQIETTCEHGNAILSRFPLYDVQAIRHTSTVCWYQRDYEPRLGGSTSLRAELRLGERTVRLYGVHFDSDFFADVLRSAQARELVADARDHTGPVVIGGDMNAYRYTVDVRLGTRLDPTTQVLKQAGYRDAHDQLPARQRGTTGRRFLVRGVIDLVFTRGVEVTESGVCAAHDAGHLSDHLPVWTRMRLD